MYALLDGHPYPVSLARLRLELGAVATITLRLGVQCPDGAVQTRLAATRAPAALQVPGMSLPFRTTAFEQVEAQDGGDPHGLDVVGIQTPDGLLEHLADRPHKGRVPWLVYQRQNEESGWLFLQRALHSKVARPAGTTALDTIFPPGACLVRPSGWDHYQHLNAVVGGLASLAPAFRGWFACLDPSQPMRLVHADDETKRPLDNEWAPLLSFFPERLRAANRPCRLRRPLQVSEAARPTLLSWLAHQGPEGERPNGVADATELVTAPGAVVYRGRTFLCRGVEHEWSTAAGSPWLCTLDLEPFESAPVASVWQSCRVHGLFRSWSDRPDNDPLRGTVRLAPAGQRWLAMSDNPALVTPDPEACLLAAFLSPAVPRPNHAGVYVRLQADDLLALDLVPGALPLALGGRQRFVEQLERSDLTLNGRSVALLASPPGNDPATQVRLDGDRGETDIQGHRVVKVQRTTMKVVAGKVAVEGDVTVSGDLQAGA